MPRYYITDPRPFHMEVPQLPSPSHPHPPFPAGKASPKQSLKMSSGHLRDHIFAVIIYSLIFTTTAFCTTPQLSFFMEILIYPWSPQALDQEFLISQ